MVQESFRRVGDVGEVSHGEATLYVRQRKLYIRIPDSIGLGRNKYIATKLPNTVNGLAKANTLLQIINNDILLESFDLSLEKYKNLYSKEEWKGEVEKYIGIDTPLQELWKAYLNTKKKKLKPSTLYYYEVTIGSVINKIPVNNIYEGEKIVAYLLKVTTNDYALRVLEKINSLFDWCKQKGLIKGSNPYKNLIEEVRSNTVTNKANPTPLTLEEENLILSKLSKVYLPLTKFLFLTGCRPSEAIGLQWKAIHDDYITLGFSERKKGKQTLVSNSSKNNKLRHFPIYDALRELLNDLPKNNDYLFFNRKGELIDYNAYYKAWKQILPNTTPYSARDTFITRQIEKGIPVAVVAQWCDNSVSVIEKHYLKVGTVVKPL